MRMRTIIAIIIAIGWFTAQAQSEMDTITLVVKTFNSGFSRLNSQIIRRTMDNQLIMFNGNFTDDVTQWQPHMFISGVEIDSWIDWMLKSAGPFNNEVTIVTVEVRSNSALVVTRETGRNKFRKWDEQLVTYLLGKVKGKWCIVGIFIRDQKNPD